MKKIILTLTLLVGIYALLRNNVGKLPDQIIWIRNPDIFYKLFIPSLMIVSSIISLVINSMKNFFILAMAVVLVDSINRIAILVNNLYGYIVYDINPYIREIYAGEELSVINVWPTYILLGIEILVIVLFFCSFKSMVIESPKNS